MTTTQYIAFPAVADTSYVLTAGPDYPRRDTFRQAAIDAVDKWHNEGRHYVVYAIEGETVRRATEVAASPGQVRKEVGK